MLNVLWCGFISSLAFSPSSHKCTSTSMLMTFIPSFFNKFFMTSTLCTVAARISTSHLLPCAIALCSSTILPNASEYLSTPKLLNICGTL